MLHKVKTDRFIIFPNVIVFFVVFFCKAAVIVVCGTCCIAPLYGGDACGGVYLSITSAL